MPSVSKGSATRRIGKLGQRPWADQKTILPPETMDADVRNRADRDTGTSNRGPRYPACGNGPTNLRRRP